MYIYIYTHVYIYIYTLIPEQVTLNLYRAFSCILQVTLNRDPISNITNTAFTKL